MLLAEAERCFENCLKLGETEEWWIKVQKFKLHVALLVLIFDFGKPLFWKTWLSYSLKYYFGATLTGSLKKELNY